MSTPHAAWLGLFLLLTLTLLLAPLYPAWKEWQQPQDVAALALQVAPAPAMALVPGQVRLHANTAPLGLVQAQERIVAMPGSRFRKLIAPQVVFASEACSPAQASTSRALIRPELIWPHGSRWGLHGWRVQGDCRVPAASHMTGPLVVTGALWLESDCLITGDITAREKVKLRAPAVVNAGVKAPLLAMEEGVVFNGTLEMSQSATREPQGTSRGQGVKLVNG